MHFREILESKLKLKTYLALIMLFLIEAFCLFLTDSDDKLGRSKRLLAPCHYLDSSSPRPPAICIPFRAGQSRGGAPSGPSPAAVGVRFKPYLSTGCLFYCTFTDSMATDKEAPLGSIENPIKFGDQDFKTLLKECLKSGELFSDPAFPPEQKSIGMPEDPDPKKAIKWQRPKVDQCVRFHHCQKAPVVIQMFLLAVIWVFTQII